MYLELEKKLWKNFEARFGYSVYLEPYTNLKCWCFATNKVNAEDGCFFGLVYEWIVLVPIRLDSDC